jgi:hypothetical protein
VLQPILDAIESDLLPTPADLRRVHIPAGIGGAFTRTFYFVVRGK